MFYANNYHSVDLGQPDFVKLAEAYGVRGVRATTRAEAMQVFRDLEGYDGPVVIDFQLEREENVWPMVPAGAAPIGNH